MSFTCDLTSFAARLRRLMGASPRAMEFAAAGRLAFDQLALELFALQFERNAAYRRFCEARRVRAHTVTHWTGIPAVPTVAFKELELSCLPAKERTSVFHSSGTTGHQPSRHFHNAESLRLYEASLLAWFKAHFQLATGSWQVANFTPAPAQAPHSSLVHMFETIGREISPGESAFVGRVAEDGAWTLDLEAALQILRKASARGRPVLVLGTAFSFVHLLDHLAERDLRLELVSGSCAMETGGYKGRSRTLPRAALHALISQRLGIPLDHIVCEYGMSELSSQSYDLRIGGPGAEPWVVASSDTSFPLTPTLSARERGSSRQRVGRAGRWGMVESRSEFLPLPKGEVRGEGKQSARQAGAAVTAITQANQARTFQFPPWARVQIISPETGREVAEGETGLIRVFDLANVYSVMAIQTEDLGIRHGNGFALVGRAATAEPRGCSLLAV